MQYVITRLIFHFKADHKWSHLINTEVELFKVVLTLLIVASQYKLFIKPK